MHVSLVPFMGASGEQKTKPTQHSVATLRSIGIQPDALVLRSDRPVTEANKRKIALMCDVDEQAVVNAVDVPSIYDIPTMLNEQGLDEYIVRTLGLSKAAEVDWSRWQRVLQAVHNPKHEVTIGLVGKYIDLPDAYLSVTEALKAGGFAEETQVKIRWIPSDACETPEGAAKALGEIDGIVVPGGFGIRGIEGKLGALRFAREQGIPTLGLCLGLQCMVIEYARHVAGLEGASSSEFDPDTEFPVIATMAEQVDILDHGDMGGTMRLGLYPADLAEGSLAAELYGSNRIDERHRHRYEVNNRYRDQIAEARAWCSPASRPTATSSSTSSCRATCTRTTSPRRRTPSCARGRPTRIRSSAGSSARRSSATVPASCSTSRMTEPVSSRESLRDEPAELEVVASDLVYEGAVWDVRSDTVRYGDGEIVRQYVDHPGASAIVARRRRRPGAADPAVPASDPPPRLGDPGGTPRHRGGVAARDRQARAHGGGRPRRRRLAAARERLHDARRQRRGRAPLPRARSVGGRPRARPRGRGGRHPHRMGAVDGCRHRRARRAAAQRHPGDGSARGGRGAPPRLGVAGGRASQRR